MNKKSLIIFITIVCVIGTCMHFVCDIFTSNTAKNILGVLFPVNETTWEHMKMMWYPFIGASIYLCIKNKTTDYIGGFVIGAIVAMLTQLGIFSFYQSFTGSSVLILDIIFYMAGMVLCLLLSLDLSKKEWCKKTWIIWIIVAVAITALIITLTYCPGSGYIFKDDTTL